MKKRHHFFQRLFCVMLSLFLLFPLFSEALPDGWGNDLRLLLTVSAEEISVSQPNTDSNGVYQIGTTEELYWFAQFVNGGETSAKAVLTADITVNSGNVAGCNGTKVSDWLDWTPIGRYFWYSSNPSTAYIGTFDGQGHTISGLYCKNPDTSNGVPAALFGYVGASGCVKNVGVVNSYFYFTYAAGVCGYNEGSLTDCYSTGTVTGTNGASLGGVCGYNAKSGTIQNCYNTGTVSADNGDCGGVCDSNHGTLVNSYNTGTVYSSICLANGICSYNYKTIQDCYNTGKVSGGMGAAGICSYNYKNGILSGCYNSGEVSSFYMGLGTAGGICDSNSGSICYCYNTGAICTESSAGGVCNSNKSTAILQNCYSIGTVSAEKAAGVCRNNKNGVIRNCYFDNTAYVGVAVLTNSGSVTNVRGKTPAQFANGHVCYCLTQGDNVAPFGQEIGKDCLPIFGGPKVYVAATCDTFSNTENYERNHQYENGTCTRCGEGQAALFNREENRYEISNATQLFWFAGLVNGADSVCAGDVLQNSAANAVLVNDIVINTGDVAGCAGTKAEGWLDWTPIGIKLYQTEVTYTGTFDGQGHTISGLYLNDTGMTNAGLFGHVGAGGTVKNVGVIDSYLRGSPTTGGICATNYGTISMCYYTGSIGGGGYAGGVCGINYGIIVNCYNRGEINSSSYGGGVCGENNQTIQNCFAVGQVDGTLTGGVCGSNLGGGIVTNCYFDNEQYTGNGIGFVSSNSVKNDVAGKTTAAFASGEICYCLAQYGDGVSWGQELGKDTYPSYGAATVYVAAACSGYSNIENYNRVHSYKDGLCQLCNAKAVAVFNAAENYYEIYNAAQLYWFAGLVNGADDVCTGEVLQNTAANAVLMNDIVLNTGDVANCGAINADGWQEWISIGYYVNKNNKAEYVGTFDGKNHTIYGLYQNQKENEVYTNTYGGFFGRTGENGVIKNVKIVNSFVSLRNGTQCNAGGVCGYNQGNIQNCHYEGTVVATKYAGGVCSYNSGSLTGCYSAGMVMGNDTAGGVCGKLQSGQLSNCFNTGTVTGKAYTGGVCGYGQSSGTIIINCYNTGAVRSEGKTTGFYYVGGICGKIDSKSVIRHCYNTGTVVDMGPDDFDEDDRYIGGVCGYSSGTITNCYFDSEQYKGEGVDYISGSKENNATGKNSRQFATGEVAYLLQQPQTEAVWGQTIGQESLPTLGGKKVLANKNLSAFANDILVYDSGVLLDGTIGMYVDVVADDSYTGWTVSINSVPTATPAKDENGLYRFTCNVAPKDMERSISFTADDKIDRTFCVSDALSELDQTADATLGALVEALENYGAAAKAFFGGETVAEQTFTGDMGEADFTIGTLPDGIRYCGSSLLLKSGITVRHYFKLDADKSITDYSFRIGDASAEMVPVEKQGYYYIEIQGIRADQLHTEFDLLINDATGIESYSVLSYAVTVMENADADANLKNLVKALYLYYQNLTAYQNSTTSQNPA